MENDVKKKVAFVAPGTVIFLTAVPCSAAPPEQIGTGGSAAANFASEYGIWIMFGIILLVALFFGIRKSCGCQCGDTCRCMCQCPHNCSCATEPWSNRVR